MPYLTNTERLALGLVGSSAPEEAVVAAAIGGSEPEPEPEAKPVKRARNKKGEYQGDDPATPDVNEAFAAE